MVSNQTTTSKLKKYYKDIKKNLVCNSNYKHAYISIIKSRIVEYMDENPDATYENIVNEFGTPKDIADGFNNHEDLDILKKKAQKYLCLKIILIFLVVLIIIISIILIKTLGTNHTIMVDNNY